MAIYSSFISRICFFTLQKIFIRLSFQRNSFNWNYSCVFINFWNYFSGIFCKSSRITANPRKPLRQKILRRLCNEMRYSSCEMDQKKGFIGSIFVSIFLSEFLSSSWPRKLSDRNKRFPMHILILFIPCVLHLLQYLFLRI